MSVRSIKLPILSTLVTLVAVVIMFALGLWQLQRAEQKSTRLAMIEVAASTSAITLAQTINSKEDIRDLPVRLTGTLNPDTYLLLDNRIHQGRVGFEVLSLLSTDSGNVLINFGWVAGDPSRLSLPEVNLPYTLQDIKGKVAIPQTNPMVSETADFVQNWPKVIQQLDLVFIQQVLQQPILPFIVQLDPVVTSGFIRQWQPVVMSPEKHIAYAIQWFGLAIAALMIYGFALRGKIKNKEQHDL
ncbi:MAG: surfeit locus 1 family protein [Paraglaciecola sp.]|jgi:surfeit locus 1 family protein